ncbi:MAG: hypothetical protein JXD23_13455 [Spirochaetales bacterium]|nr:hypothetical protein [Spirochaetales bacterium]
MNKKKYTDTSVPDKIGFYYELLDSAAIERTPNFNDRSAIIGAPVVLLSLNDNAETYAILLDWDEPSSEILVNKINAIFEKLEKTYPLEK